MMNDNIINFRKAKKKVVHKKKDKKASENRVKSGRTKAEKNLDKAKIKKLHKHVDDHELDP